MIENRIILGAKAMKISITDETVQKIVRFDALLREGNTKMNLTRGMDDPIEACDRHYLDALSILQTDAFPKGMRNLIDVGAGAGLPGIVLACALPDVRITLLDSLNKRVEFMNEVIKELSLNAQAIHARAEEAGQSAAMREKFDCATSRAVARLNVLCEWTLPFVRVGGRLCAYKGPTCGEEAEEAKHALSVLGADEGKMLGVTIPERDWNHVIFVAEKTTATPKAYPRKGGKKPL